MEINHEEFHKVLDINRRKRKSVMILGATGIGKSYSVESYAKYLAASEGRKYMDWNSLTMDDKRALVNDAELRKGSMIFADVRVSLMDPGDFRLPHVNGQAYTEWRPGILFHVLSLEGTCAFLFMDELTHANPSMQAAAFQVVHNHAVGDVAFAPGVFIIGAGNRVEDRAGAFEMLLPLRGRFSNYTLRSPTVDEWCAWAMVKEVDARIISFMRFAPSKLADKVADAIKTKGQGFACCRTWTDASDLIKDIKIEFDESPAAKTEKLNTLHLITAGRVGEGHSKAFTSFVKLGINVDLDSILKHPEQAARLDLDAKWTIVGGMAEIYRGSPKKLDSILGVLGFIEDDLAVASLRMIYSWEGKGSPRGRNEFTKKIMACKNSQEIQKHLKYFAEM